jgi:hypothetical protein
MPSAAPLPRSPSILTLYSAEDLLVAPGCPVCHYAAEASDRYLTWMALEGHAQTDTITRLCAGLGACAAHTRRLAAQPGAAIRLTAVYRYIVTTARDQLAGRAARPMACMACEHDAAAAGRAVETLLEGLQDNVVRDKYRDLGSLCLPHLDAAAVIDRHRDVSWLTGRMQETITGGAAPGWLIGIDRDAEDRTGPAQGTAGDRDHAAVVLPAVPGRSAGRAGCSGAPPRPGRRHLRASRDLVRRASFRCGRDCQP